MEHIWQRKPNVPFDALPSTNHPQTVQPLLHNSRAKRPNSIYCKHKVSGLGSAFSSDFFFYSHLLRNESDLIIILIASVVIINTTYHTLQTLFKNTQTGLWNQRSYDFCKNMSGRRNEAHYLLSATMSSDGSLSGSTQSCSVVVEIARGIHLVLRIEGEKTGLCTNLRTWPEKCRCGFYKLKFLMSPKSIHSSLS